MNTLLVVAVPGAAVPVARSFAGGGADVARRLSPAAAAVQRLKPFPARLRPVFGHITFRPDLRF